jgi:hypothetical protein
MTTKTKRTLEGVIYEWSCDISKKQPRRTVKALNIFEMRVLANRIRKCFRDETPFRKRGSEKVLARGWALIRDGKLKTDMVGNYLISPENNWVEKSMMVRVKVVEDEKAVKKKKKPERDEEEDIRLTALGGYLP